MDFCSIYKYWVLHNNIFYHFTIDLQFDVDPLDTFTPFKFDHSWLKKDDLYEMIRVFWSNIICTMDINVMDVLVFKLKALKKEVTIWTQNKSIKNRAYLQQIETHISDLFLSNMIGCFLTKDKENYNF